MRSPIVLAFSLTVAACAGAPHDAPQAAPQRPTALSPETAASLEEARALVSGGRPREALAELDVVLGKSPSLREAWLLRAAACFKAAENDTQPQFYYEDALSALERARALRDDPALDFDAARAARMLLRLDEAARYATRAEESVRAPTREQERVLIEVSFDRYIRARQAGDENATDLRNEVEERLTTRLAATPDDAWALNQLANLYLWEQRPDAAVEALGQLVRSSPDDEAAHSRFVQLMRSVEGPTSVVAFYERMRRDAPGAALAPWFEAVELFEIGLAELAAKRDAVESFQLAEELFANCRGLDAKYEQSCRGYEVMCRAGVGWSRFHAGDAAGAESAFRSTEEVFEGGADWRIENRLPSGLTGLMHLADRAYRSAEDELDYRAAAEAARLYAVMRELRPQDAEIANNAGFFHREWGVPLLMHSRALRAAARAASDEGNRAELEARADALEAQGRDVIAACCDAYKACADLAPDNVRWVNSYALMLVYHYPSRVDEAERLLQHCVVEGERQSQDPARSAEERELIAEGWGDANQNLGMIELVHRKNPIRALMYFQRSFDIGPRPRIDRRWVEEVAMHWCREVADGKPLDLEALDPRIFLLE